MKVLYVWEVETPKDEAKRKEYYEQDQKFKQFWAEKFSGVKVKYLGGWSDQPVYYITMSEFESIEEFSKIRSDVEYHREVNKLRNTLKSLKIRIMRPLVANPPKKN